MKRKSAVMVLCDTKGVVTAVLHEGPDLKGFVKHGNPLTATVTPDSMAKMLDFITTLGRDGSAYDWEMCVDDPIGTINYRFSGAVAREGMMVTMIPTDGHADFLFQELAKTNSDHVTMIRRLVKERARIEESVREAKAQGLAEGEVKGKAKMIINILRRRFNNLPSIVENKVRAASGEQLDEWGSLLIGSDSLECIFGTCLGESFDVTPEIGAIR